MTKQIINTSRSNSLRNKILGNEEGTTGPEWGSRVCKILEADNQELEKFTIPEDAYISKCRICGSLPMGVFVVVEGKSKYQYRCLRCGNIGIIADTEFVIRGTWNMENGGQTSLLRELVAQFEEYMLDVAEIKQIAVSLKELVQAVEHGNSQTFEIEKLIKGLTTGYGMETALKIKMDAAPLSGNLTSDIPETIHMVNSGNNDTARATEIGFSDIARSMNSIAEAIANMNIPTK